MSASTETHLAPELKLKIMTVRKAVKQSFTEMPEKFFILNLCRRARGLMQSKTMDGTITRRLRELREAGKCPYKVIDGVNGLYEKI